MSEWSFLLFLHFFLLFFHPHASHQVTINSSTQALTFVHDIRPKKVIIIIIQIFSSLGRMSLCFLWPIFLLPSACSTLLISSLVKRHGWHEDFRDKLIRVCFGYRSLILLKTEIENNKKIIIEGEKKPFRLPLPVLHRRQLLCWFVIFF